MLVQQSWKGVAQLKNQPDPSPRERNHVPNVRHAGRVQDRAARSPNQSLRAAPCRTSEDHGTTNAARSQDRTPRCGGPRHQAALRVVIRQ